MKKQDKHPIDSFFKENITQDFPYDPALWNKADKGIAALFNKKRILYFSLLFLLFISSVAVFFANTESKQEKISRTGKNEKMVLSKKSSVTKSSGYTNSSDEIAIQSSIEKAEVSSATAVSNSDEEIQNPKFEQKENTESQNGEKLKIESKEEIKEKESTVIPSMIVPAVSEETPITKMVAEEKILFTDFVMMTKPFKSFINSNAIISQPSKCPGIINEKRKRGFATTIEFENTKSLLLQTQISGLPKDYLAFKKQGETAKNMNAYGLNIMFQRGGWGLVSGLGWSQASVNIHYQSDSNRYQIIKTPVVKYKMIQDSIKYEGGYYSKISTYTDTAYSKSEAFKGYTSQNDFNWLSIPLKLSYQYSIARLRFSGRIGADFMWLYSSKGTFINSRLDALNTDEKLNRFNVNASGQLMAGYQLNHKIQVGGSVYLNQQLGSNFTDYNSRFKSKGFGWYVRWSL